MRASWIRAVSMGLLIIVTCVAKSNDLESSKQALSKLQDYVGEWRGVGQPRRGSTRGAWQEEIAWAWRFEDGEAYLTFVVEDAKFYDAGYLKPREEPREDGQHFTLKAKSKGEPAHEYLGAIDEDGVLRLTAVDDAGNKPGRISIRQVADGKRLLMLYEKRLAADRFTRLAEVGYTREGSNFGKGQNFVECVVTGGVGTIAVTHEGKTYYVCCSGCRDYFNDDPAAVLAEYRQRKAEERRKAEAGDE